VYYAVSVFVLGILAFAFLFPWFDDYRMVTTSILMGCTWVSHTLFIYFMTFMMGLAERRRKSLAPFLMSIPALISAIAFSNPWTRLFTELSPIFIAGMLVVFLGMIVIIAKSPQAHFRKAGFLNVTLIIAMVILSIGNYIPRMLPLFSGMGLPYLGVTLTALVIIRVFWGYLAASRNIAAELMDVIYLVFDTFGRCTDMNRSGAEFFESNQILPQGTTIQALIGLTGIPLKTLMSGQEHTFQLRRDGQPARHYAIRRFTASRIHPWGANAVGVAIHDITRFKFQEHFLSDMANWDALTKIHNRRFFYTFFGNLKSFDEETTHSVLMVDIDFFKTINDTWGHLAGDEVLTQLAQRCKDCLRTSDVICRYGGEEFLFLLTGCDPPELPLIAERIRDTIGTAPFVVTGGISIPVTVSVGGYSFTLKKDTDVDYVVDQVDAAMYQAKTNGRNRVYITQ
jgi:diguanylate cyclase (GGDEF)-like protein